MLCRSLLIAVSTFFHVDLICLFTTALRSVTTDQSFSVPSPAKKKAVKTASAVTLWYDCLHNRVHLHLGVLCCFALFICLTLLASFFLPSHLSFKNMYILGLVFGVIGGFITPAFSFILS